MKVRTNVKYYEVCRVQVQHTVKTPAKCDLNNEIQENEASSKHNVNSKVGRYVTALPSSQSSCNYKDSGSKL